MVIWAETYKARHGVEATRSQSADILLYLGIYRLCARSIMQKGSSFVPDTRSMCEGLSALEASVRMLQQTSTAIFKLE
jgi:hypothetical protein